MEDIKSLIRDIPDFPKEGIIFRDITTAVKDANGMKKIIDLMCEEFEGKKIDYVAGIESRGFIFGMPIAYKLGCGFVPIRKPGKLPCETISQEYSLEYGTDKIEIHKDAFKEGDRVLLVDDLLATGGTAAAACALIKSTGAILEGISFVIELEDLNGRAKLPADTKIVTLAKY